MTKLRLLIVIIFVIILVISGYLLFNSWQSQTSKSDREVTITEVNPEAVTGRWQRTDGAYVIEISYAHNNGILDAAYFNPRPINVSLAEWSMVANRLHIYVELGDVNYPGSYYKLDYFPEQDQMLGIYFQAVYKQTYDVQFVRMRNE